MFGPITIFQLIVLTTVFTLLMRQPDNDWRKGYGYVGLGMLIAYGIAYGLALFVEPGYTQDQMREVFNIYFSPIRKEQLFGLWGIFIGSLLFFSVFIELWYWKLKGWARK